MKCIEDEIPFEIPAGWEWTRLGTLAHYKKGPFGSSITKSMFIPESDDAIKIYEQQNAINKSAKLGHYFISQDKFEELKGFEVFPGDVIVSCAGTIGETFVMPQDMRKGIINQALMKISLYDDGIKSFYLMYFDNKLKALANEQGYGMALKNIPPFDVLKQYLMPIPPKEEQLRILDQTSYFIGIIEKISDDSKDLQKCISLLKSKILDLAIRGQLVPQNPDEEPASVLLDRIRAEKEELIKAGKIKRDKKESVIFKGEDNSYYEDIPQNWSEVSLLSIAEVELGKTLDSAKNSGIPHDYLRSINIRWNGTDLSDVKQMKFEPNEFERYTVHKGDLLICEGGDVGRCCIWEKDETIFYQNAIHRVRFYGNCSSRFFLYYMMYLESIGYLKRVSNGVTIKHLTKSVLASIPLLLPPVEEQARIVNTIEKLFNYLDSIIKAVD